jgi:hypothetical protein
MFCHRSTTRPFSVSATHLAAHGDAEVEWFVRPAADVRPKFDLLRQRVLQAA